MENRLKAKYESEVRPSLIEKFNYSSVMAAPKIEKVVLNMGVGDATLVSVFVKEWQLVRRLLFVVIGCMTSWIS